mmetsp:Transcript_5631/g.13230  ORF Transcript_5631/g.13230 Transcript_5631/m.13230 type:complete len:260 (+) Transcript_5631:117-896(+)
METKRTKDKGTLSECLTDRQNRRLDVNIDIHDNSINKTRMQQRSSLCTQEWNCQSEHCLDQSFNDGASSLFFRWQCRTEHRSPTRLAHGKVVQPNHILSRNKWLTTSDSSASDKAPTKSSNSRHSPSPSDTAMLTPWSCSYLQRIRHATSLRMMCRTSSSSLCFLKPQPSSSSSSLSTFIGVTIAGASSKVKSFVYRWVTTCSGTLSASRCLNSSTIAAKNRRALMPRPGTARAADSRSTSRSATCRSLVLTSLTSVLL